MNHLHSCLPRRGVSRLGAAWILALLLAGCGKGSGNLAPVSGKVFHNGAAVSGGTLIFSPVGGDAPGRPATAEIGADGAYALTTEAPGDGGRIGLHRVGFTPPEQELTEEQRTNPKYIAPPPRYLHLSPKEGQVEVKAGSNTIDIELVPERR